ncbi:MAG: MFS transporter [Candidatus Nealsonbacteria bacterium]|nr:MFS transporter [Candidatus Nealsonbacteria bacterium]
MRINKIIKILILSDLIFWSGWGLIAPILAIFITDRIQDGSTLAVGIASGVYWILNSLLRVPFGSFLDGRPGEEDDYVFLVLGLFISAVTPFLFLFARLSWHVYLIQALRAASMAMTLSGYAAIFTRHIDKEKEATEWGLDATFVGLGMGVAGVVGGWAVQRFGFDSVLIAVGTLELLGASVLLFLKDEMGGFKEKSFYFSFREVFQKEEER